MSKLLTNTALFLSILTLLVGCSEGKVAVSSCTVEEVEDGAIIVCGNGPQVLVRHGSNGIDGQNGSDAQNCQTPVSTYHMMNYKLIATREYDWRLENAETIYQDCLEAGVSTPEECREYYLQIKYSAYRHYVIRGNWFPQNECGAEVMVMTKTLEEYVAEDGLYGIWSPVVSEDADGDGISNYHEFFMGLNPCTPQTFGCINDADGDFDFDGIPNGDDHSSTHGPYCPEDASYWPAECI